MKKDKVPHPVRPGTDRPQAGAYSTRRSLCDAAWETVRTCEREEDERLRAYRAYIASPAWLESPARLAELRAARHSCRICDRGPPRVRLEVHHRTYRNLGFEEVSDLTTLCATCHGVVSEMLRDRRRQSGFGFPR